VERSLTFSDLGDQGRPISHEARRCQFPVRRPRLLQRAAEYPQRYANDQD
jgi:hypothetical protein